MFILLLRRVLAGVVVLFVVSTLTFFMLYASTSHVARNILGETATQAQVQQKIAELGLDQPLISRYVDWLGAALHGDFGTSWFTSRPVELTVLQRLPVTLSILVTATILAAILATLVGVTAAVRRGWLDRAVQVLSIGGAAVPQFIVAIVLVTVFAVSLGWFPATGYTSFTTSPSAWVVAVTLPVIALIVSTVASTAQQVRSATITVFNKDYVRTLRSRGLGRNEVLFRHVLRDAAPAGMTVLSLHFIGMLGGIVVIEEIFALEGVGQLALEAAIKGDMPVLMATVVHLVLVVVVVNLLVDVLVSWLNPKARVK